MSLFAKIAQVQAEIGGLKNDRTVRVQSDKASYTYDYITDSAIFSQVRRLLAPLGVAIFVSVENEGQRGSLTVVTVAITFADGESGETFVIRGVGYGSDKADKGCGKAITSAVRYALVKQFLQGGDEDGEAEAMPRSQRDAERAPHIALVPVDVVRETLRGLDPPQAALLKQALVMAGVPMSGTTGEKIAAIAGRVSLEQWHEVMAAIAAVNGNGAEPSFPGDLPDVQRKQSREKPSAVERRDKDDAKAQAEADELFGKAMQDVATIAPYGAGAPS